MSDVLFDDPGLGNVLWGVVAVTLVGLSGLWRRRRALRQFASEDLLATLARGRRPWRPLVSLLLAVVALAAMVIAIAGPRWGPRDMPTLRRDLDVLVVLDVSRSMLAPDLAPNRLERAKLALRDDLLPVLGGERIGLLTFAGQTALNCPLTVDYGAFRLALQTVSTRSAGRGGSLVGDALRAAPRYFRDDVDSQRLVLLITDGEDQDSFPVAAAAALWQEHLTPVLAIALGDATAGAPIPIGGPAGGAFVEWQGAPVRSRADFTLLQQVAAASDTGVCIPVGTRNFDLGRIYADVAGRLRAREDRDQLRRTRPARGQWFALAALLCLLTDAWIAPSRRARRRPAPRTLPLRAAMYSSVFLLLGAAAPGTDPRESVVARYAGGDYSAVLEALDPAHAATPAPEIAFYRGAALYRLGRYEDARTAFAELRGRGDATFDALLAYNMGDCDHQAALAAVPTAPPRAALLLARATTSYQEALRLAPDWAAPRANLELAARLREAIEPPNEPPPEQPSEPQDEGDDGHGDGDGAQSDAGTEASKKPRPEERRADDAQAPPPANPRPAENQPRARELEQPPSEGPPQPAKQPPEIETPVVHMTPTQAERLLQMVRDAQQARAEQRVREQQAQLPPVERDW